MKKSHQIPSLALESLSIRKKRWEKIEPILEKHYPAPKIGLMGWKNPLELLISTILSAQCTDVRVNMVTKTLFKKYKKPEDYLRVPAKEMENDIRSTGFYKNKTKNIRNCCAMLIKEFKGKVPKTMSELVTLPGVGRKTANIVLANAFDTKEGIAVDTHVFRVSRRMGLSNANTAEKVETNLMEIVLHPKWDVFTDVLIWHGRKICNARKPLCSICPIAKYCPKIGVTKMG